MNNSKSQAKPRIIQNSKLKTPNSFGLARKKIPEGMFLVSGTFSPGTHLKNVAYDV